MIIKSLYQIPLDMNLIRFTMLHLVGEDVESKLYEYDDNTRNYHEALLIEAGLVHGTNTESTDGRYLPIVSCLTWEGQQFFNTIRDDGVWSSVKQRLSVVKSFTLPIIQAVATEVIKAKIGE